MRTFNDVVGELRGKMRNATYITILKTAGMNAVILEDGEKVVNAAGEPICVDIEVNDGTPEGAAVADECNAVIAEIMEQVEAEEAVVVVEEPLQRTKVRKSRWNESPDEPVADHDQE